MLARGRWTGVGSLGSLVHPLFWYSPKAPLGLDNIQTVAKRSVPISTSCEMFFSFSVAVFMRFRVTFMLASSSSTLLRGSQFFLLVRLSSRTFGVALWLDLAMRAYLQLLGLFYPHERAVILLWEKADRSLSLCSGEKYSLLLDWTLEPDDVSCII